MADDLAKMICSNFVFTEWKNGYGVVTKTNKGETYTLFGTLLDAFKETIDNIEKIDDQPYLHTASIRFYKVAQLTGIGNWKTLMQKWIDEEERELVQLLPTISVKAETRRTQSLKILMVGVVVPLWAFWKDVSIPDVWSTLRPTPTQSGIRSSVIIRLRIRQSFQTLMSVSLRMRSLRRSSKSVGRGTEKQNPEEAACSPDLYIVLTVVRSFTMVRPITIVQRVHSLAAPSIGNTRTNAVPITFERRYCSSWSFSTSKQSPGTSTVMRLISVR